MRGVWSMIDGTLQAYRPLEVSASMMRVSASSSVGFRIYSGSTDNDVRRFIAGSVDMCLRSNVKKASDCPRSSSVAVAHSGLFNLRV